MKYLTVEIQTTVDGSVAQITAVHQTEAEAASAYHTVLAAAALSSLPAHGCVLLDSSGRLVASQCYGQGLG